MVEKPMPVAHEETKEKLKQKKNNWVTYMTD